VGYEVVDAALYYRFEKRLPEEEIVKVAGVGREIVDRILAMVKRAQHKRLPLEVFHVGYRDLGSDWRYPRQWWTKSYSH